MQPGMNTLSYWGCTVKGEVAVARHSFVVVVRWCWGLKGCKLKWNVNGFDEKVSLRSDYSVWSKHFA